MTEIKTLSHSNPNRWITIYPTYLDSRRSQEQGRKIAKEKAVEKPTAVEIHDILAAAGLNVVLEKQKIYSRNQEKEPGTQGRVKVQLKNDDGKPRNIGFPTPEMIPKLKTRQPGYVAPESVDLSGGKKNKKKK